MLTRTGAVVLCDEKALAGVQPQRSLQITSLQSNHHTHGETWCFPYRCQNGISIQSKRLPDKAGRTVCWSINSITLTKGPEACWLRRGQTIKYRRGH